jgi:hypothetical protein
VFEAHDGGFGRNQTILNRCEDAMAAQRGNAKPSTIRLNDPARVPGGWLRAVQVRFNPLAGSDVMLLAWLRIGGGL